MELRTAQRTMAKIKMAVQGPSGSGKTLGSLLLAYGLTNDWTKIAVIDTENNSADLYSHLGLYQVLDLSSPYTPERYIQAIEICENAGIEVVIIDSISHEWDGEGGILETHGAMLGNSFTNWSKLTPRHNAFVQKILSSRCHIICTIRSKQDYVLSEKNGKAVPEKMGLKGITREGMDYEFTLVLELDLKHQAKASKDRTGLFMDKPDFLLSPKIGIQIKGWCNADEAFDKLKDEIARCNTVLGLRQLFQRHPQYSAQLKEVFQARRQELEKAILPIN